jgi:hypothetical protein
MQATADSKIVRINGTGKAKIPVIIGREVNAFPNNDISRCPAIKLAVSRTHNVIGRMILLTNSIITMNIIKAEGVPCGTRCDNIWLVFFNQPNNIKDDQNNKEIGRVTVK